ncbi:MAG: tetratricopeptide repeat protein [Bacteroidales bacterium]
MKSPIFTVVFLFLAVFAFSQESADSLIQLGIQHHDNGQYGEAIKAYQQALDIDDESMIAHYEIALSYMHAEEYKKAIKHSDIVIKSGGKHALAAYVTKGSSLDYLGKTKKSIKLFKKAINEFGDHYLLHYNLAYNYYHLEKYKEAEESAINAINSNTAHSSSHLLLGYIKSDQNQKVQSILSLHFFLLLEPHSDRAKVAYNLLSDQFRGNVEKDEDKPGEINIYVNADNEDSDFSAAELMLSMLEASNNIEENKEKTKEELFIENTSSFFNILGELNEEDKDGLWWDMYIPVLYNIAQSEHMDTYCYYISQSGNEKAQQWLKDNEDKLKAFASWMNEN